MCTFTHAVASFLYPFKLLSNNSPLTEILSDAMIGFGIG